MSPIIESTNFYLALAGIVAIALTAILIIDERHERALAGIIKGYGLLLAFLVSIIASGMALVYSEVFGFVPCGLCWLERMFFFPQFFMLLAAIYIKDTHVARYGLVLSLVGLVISLYHHYLQLGGSAFVKCPAAGDVDCAKRFMYEFDFMTFPLLAAAGFALLSALYYYMLRVNR